MLKECCKFFYLLALGVLYSLVIPRETEVSEFSGRAVFDAYLCQLHIAAANWQHYKVLRHSVEEDRLADHRRGLRSLLADADW